LKFKYAYILILCIKITMSYSQGEGNIWYFGQNAGLNFNSGSPVALTNGMINTTEGCSTISDATGQLLFYSDGITVWNRNHQIMPNGSGLSGHVSSTQSAVMVPKPGSTNLYYIFTTPEKADVLGARYSIVDMNLDGGLGDITGSKNILIKTPVCEKIAVVKKDNLDEYWVVFHGFGSNSFFAYSISAAGFNNTPVVSNSGTVVSFSGSGQNDHAIGYLKFSTNGERLLCCNSYLNTELFDFDSTTGTVSNPRVIYTGTQYYGAEFSPSGDLLYLSGGGFSNPKIFQYDLTAADISSSEQLIFNSFNSEEFGALQLAQNNKIYIARNNRTSLAAINNPDAIGTNCMFQLNGVSLAPKSSKCGLPQFVQTIFEPFFKVDNLCFNSLTQFTLETSIVPNSVLWNFGDTQTSTALNPSHTYANSGNYNVSITVNTNNGSFTKNRQITIMPTPIIANTIANQQICGSPLMIFDLSQFNSPLLGSQSSTVFGVDYFSSLSDAANHVNALPLNSNLQSGINTFYAKIFNRSNKECSAITSFSVDFFLNPMANMPNNIFKCDVNNTGLGVIDLQNNTSAILGTQNTTQYLVSYYLNQNDADNNSNPLSLNYNNISNPQTIYARVETSNPGATCFATTFFQIGFNAIPTANQPPDLFECDLGADGVEVFDLSQQSSVILNTQSATDFTVSYHLSASDANTGINGVSANFDNSTNPQTIYVRLENKLNALCFTTTSFELHLLAEPILNMDETYSNCEGNVLTVSAPSGFSSYTWSNGATTQSTSFSTAGSYSLTVTKDYGTVICDATKSFEVYNSNTATITNIDIQDWTDNQNVIAIEVTGNGDYEYSLDGVHYQHSNIFTGLDSGQYTVHVNDIKGCGETTEEVLLLMYPKFFTPNGDGVNDNWQIRFSLTEPNMEITLFDRYGKLLTNFNGLSFGWDGTYNGKLLPSTDYWFVVKRQNGKEYKGHFTLKR
jgi:gliding motility-associated-like protein